jgi:hypothetical protein
MQPFHHWPAVFLMEVEPLFWRQRPWNLFRRQNWIGRWTTYQALVAARQEAVVALDNSTAKRRWSVP